MNIQSRTLVGYLDQINKNSIDWSLNNIIAYGCQSTIAIFDPELIQIIQTLDNRKGLITKLKWSNTKLNKNDLSREIRLKLASGDDLGNLTIWDVCEGLIINEFNETANLVNNFNTNFKPAIVDIKWINGLDTSSNDDFLLSLHSHNTLILWNVDSGTKIWSKNFTETLFQISIDPFLNKRIALLSSNYIQFIEDFSLTQIPQNQPRRFHITNSSSSSSGSGSGSLSNSSSSNILINEKNSQTGGIFAASFWLKTFVENTSESKSQQQRDQNESSVSLNDCLQIEFSSLNKNILFVLYSKEIFIFDLVINQTVGYVQLERSGSLFIQIYLCNQRDVIYCLHDNGSVSLRVRLQDQLELNENLNYETLYPHDFVYDNRTQSDPIRITKQIRPFSFCISPINEKNLCLLFSDGRLLNLELGKQITCLNFNDDNEENENDKKMKNISYDEFVKTKRQYLKDLINSSKGNDLLKLNLKFYLNSMFNNLPQLPFVMKICPPMTRKNWTFYESLLAVGCTNGDLYAFQLETGILWRKYSLHNYPIRGIEWVNLKSVLTWSNTGPTNMNNSGTGQNISGSNSLSTNSNSSTLNVIGSDGKQLVKNEIFYTDLITGETNQIRSDITNEESPILSIKTSYLKQYFIIIFKEQPLEIWDLKSFTIIRKLSNKSPIITILEWSPSFTKKQANQSTPTANEEFKRKFSLPSHSDDQTSVASEDILQTKSFTPESTANQSMIVKENFICIDNTGLMYSFYVEGHTIKDGSKVLLEDGSLTNIISIALKNDYIVFGDEYGNLNIWELKNKLSKTIHTKRGAIRKLKFAPGKENLRLLIQYSMNSVEIFDLNQSESISHLKIREKFYDIDWCSCDKPIILMSDGCIRIFDINLKQIPNQINYLKYSLNLFNRNINFDTLANKKFVIDEYIALKYLLFDSLDKNYGYEVILNKKSSEFFLNEKNLHLNLVEIVNNLNNNVKLLINSHSLLNIESKNNKYINALNLVLKYELCSSYIYLDNQFEYKIWQVMRNYLKYQILSTSNPNDDEYKFVQSLPNLDGDLIIYDTLLFRQNELKYLKLYEQKRITSTQNKNLINDLLLANQLDKVFNLLLESEPTSSNYLNDYLKACLVNSMKLNELLTIDNNSENTVAANLKSSIKLIATNLIANGKLNDGVQLLCLIGLVLDACRYLQDNSQWDKAIWLAKMRLNDENLNDVIKRWSDNLCLPQVNKKNHAILLLISGGQFSKAIEIMFSYREYAHIAFLFQDLCINYDLIKIKENNEQINDDENTSKVITSNNFLSRDLCNEVYAKNAKLIYKLDNMSMFKYLCEKAGSIGEELLSN